MCQYAEAAQHATQFTGRQLMRLLVTARAAPVQPLTVRHIEQCLDQLFDPNAIQMERVKYDANVTQQQYRLVFFLVLGKLQRRRARLGTTAKVIGDGQQRAPIVCGTVAELWRYRRFGQVEREIGRLPVEPVAQHVALLLKSKVLSVQLWERLALWRLPLHFHNDAAAQQR